MMYRDALDALNALVIEQRRTNELLEKVIETMASKTTAVEPVNKQDQKRNYQRRTAQ